MPKKVYSTDENGVTRINPCQKMTINGVICGAGTIIEIGNKPVEKEAVENG